MAAVLKNPACPDKLHTAITDALSEIETHSDTLCFNFLFGLLLSSRAGLRKRRAVPHEQNHPWRFLEF